MKHSIFLILTLLFCCRLFAQNNTMMIRISEIEIDSSHLEQYRAILKEESKASVQLEPGVISIYPMYQKEHPTQLRILEKYACRVAFDAL
jgi:quinol monooxygenase YgiN